jgi:hypothetical protein
MPIMHAQRMLRIVAAQIIAFTIIIIAVSLFTEMSTTFASENEVILFIKL